MSLEQDDHTERQIRPLDSLSDKEEDGSFQGVYKLEQHEQWDKFLSILGVSWAARSAAVRTKPIHFVTHDGDTVTIKIKGVPRVTYHLGGPAVVNVLGSRSFVCQAEYTPELDGFQVHKEALEGDLNVCLQWKLATDNETVHLNLTAIFTQEDEVDRKPVECTHIYKRIGEF